METNAQSDAWILVTQYSVKLWIMTINYNLFVIRVVGYQSGAGLLSGTICSSRPSDNLHTGFWLAFPKGPLFWF